MRTAGCTRGGIALLLACCFLAACGSDDEGARDPGAATDPGSVADLGATDPGVADPGATDPGATDPGTTDPGGDPGPEDVAVDEGPPPTGLPTALPFSYERESSGEPVSDAEVTAFTKKVMAFLKKVRYADYVLYTTHGVDASTGKKDWQFWYNERFRKEGDLVTFFHPTNENDGGHNLHIPFSRVLGDLIAGYLITADETMGIATQQLCKGMSASMTGMVYDENDQIRHLMTRNVVPGFPQEFLTHDGKKKAVDCSGWFYPNVRWNTWRFKYENNPDWGEVWVTNMRSKDDVPHIFRLVPNLRYLVEEGPEGDVREACAEALELLELFAKDIVDSGYYIRTKDEKGEPFIPGKLGDPDLDKEKDLASFVTYEDFVPNGECNAKRGSELIGYREATASDCGRGEPNAYDAIAFVGNRYNKRICRYFHLAHLGNSLVNRDPAAADLMSGLEERMQLEWDTPEEKMQYEPQDWYRNLALYHAQAYTFGYPLTNDEVRAIHDFYGRAVDEMAEWPYWDPWADSVPDVDGKSYRPPSCKGGGEEHECWWRVEDLGQVFEACWSPFTNPASAHWVDCEVVKDPARWTD